ncbi:MAG: F0F1 ATP synthase subunit gamma, partial [Lewinella sp.]|nr:F0F1 ATP synthase subunit gamma [Lewinella sp.]
MKDTLESLRHKIDRATELGSVVRSMKALSAAGIRQYEQAVTALEEYYRTVELGLWVCREELGTMFRRPPGQEARIGAVVFGSSQGLVGQFNDQIVQFARERLANLPGPKLTWAVGEIIRPRLADEGLPPARTFASPHSVQAITPLISQLLTAVEDALATGTVNT